MLEAGSNPRLRTKGGLTAFQLVDPRNTALRDLIQKHEYAMQNAGDFVAAKSSHAQPSNAPPPPPGQAAPPVPSQLDDEEEESDFDEDAEFSGSDEEERAEWERRRKEKKQSRK